MADYALLGIFAASGTAFGVDLLRRISERRGERKAVAGAFLGEITGIHAIIERRGYIEFIGGMVERNGSSTPKPEYPVISVRRAPTVIFQQMAGKIGHLPPTLARDIGRHYMLVNSILEDFDDAAAYDQLSEDRKTKIPAAAVCRRVAELHRLLVEVFELEAGLISQLAKVVEP